MSSHSAETSDRAAWRLVPLNPGLPCPTAIFILAKSMHTLYAYAGSGDLDSFPIGLNRLFVVHFH